MNVHTAMCSEGYAKLGFQPRESRKRWYDTKPEMDPEAVSCWNSGEHVLGRATRVTKKLLGNVRRIVQGHCTTNTIRGHRKNTYAAPMAGST